MAGPNDKAPAPPLYDAHMGGFSMNRRSYVALRGLPGASV